MGVMYESNTTVYGADDCASTVAGMNVSAASSNTRTRDGTPLARDPVMPQNKDEPNPSGKMPAPESRSDVNVGCPPGKNSGADDFESTGELDGKSDSGPEPDVHGREIPPQD